MSAPLVARCAPVRPRTRSPETGDVLLLEDEIAPLIARHTSGLILIHGPAGSGKTTAVSHLAAVLAAAAHLRFLDDAPLSEAIAAASVSLVVATSPVSGPDAPEILAQCPLVPWGEDEFIEYLLAMHPGRCRAVMAALAAAPDRNRLRGVPELCRVVLDRLAADDSLRRVGDALRREIEMRLPEESTRRLLRAVCVDRNASNERRLQRTGCDPVVLRLARHPAVQVVLAAEEIADLLRRLGRCEYLRGQLPRELVAELAALVADTLRRILTQILAGRDRDAHATAASVLHRADANWRPRPPLPYLEGAFLERVRWSGLELAGIVLARADLSGADLSGARLERANVTKANLNGACLADAALERLWARGTILCLAALRNAGLRYARLEEADLQDADLTCANLTGAKLQHANLSGARLCGAVLTHAVLCGAEVEGCDFSDADLNAADLRGLRLASTTLAGTRLARALLAGCDLEFVELPDADLNGANLQDALLTGARMPRADLRHAVFKGAGLADVDWEQADLRQADLSGATFHMGSTRSGLVGSPLACEGSRTGFYTDDFDEQHYMPPEEIRKANLCRADLRGARIDGVDFYLVDLRGARYDADQREHFERCGAILHDRQAEAPG